MNTCVTCCQRKGLESGWRVPCDTLNRLAVVAAISFFAVFCGTLCASAATFEILYDSFESPDISGNTGGTPVEWTKEHSYSGMIDTNWNTNWISTAFGSQVIKCWNGTGFKTSAITDVLLPGATYTLTFNVGNVNTETGVPRSGHGYIAYLLAGTNVIGSVSGTTSTDTLTSTNVISVTTTPAHPHLGKTLGIRLIDNGGASWQWQTLYDNVKLSVDEAREWNRTLFHGK